MTCYKCGSDRHLSGSCPLKGKGKAKGRSHFSDSLFAGYNASGTSVPTMLWPSEGAGTIFSGVSVATEQYTLSDNDAPLISLEELPADVEESSRATDQWQPSVRSLVELYNTASWTQPRSSSSPPASGQESHGQESRGWQPTYSCGTSVLTNVVDWQLPEGTSQSPDEDADAEEEPAEEPEEVCEELFEQSAGLTGQVAFDRGACGGLPLTTLAGLGDTVRRHRSRNTPQWNGPLQAEPASSGAWFPTDVETAFAASVRLPHGTSLLVDTGSPGNITGSEWTADHSRELAAASLPPPRYSKRERPVVCSGVGTGSQSAVHDVEVPIALGNDRLDGYRAPELPDSRTPALLGRNAMRAKRVLLDTFTG